MPGTLSSRASAMALTSSPLFPTSSFDPVEDRREPGRRADGCRRRRGGAVPRVHDPRVRSQPARIMSSCAVVPSTLDSLRKLLWQEEVLEFGMRQVVGVDVEVVKEEEQRTLADAAARAFKPSSRDPLTQPLCRVRVLGVRSKREMATASSPKQFPPRRSHGQSVRSQTKTCVATPHGAIPRVAKLRRERGTRLREPVRAAANRSLGKGRGPSTSMRGTGGSRAKSTRRSSNTDASFLRGRLGPARYHERDRKCPDGRGGGCRERSVQSRRGGEADPPGVGHSNAQAKAHARAETTARAPSHGMRRRDAGVPSRRRGGWETGFTGGYSHSTKR